MAFAVAHFAVKEGGKLEVAGGRVEDERGCDGSLGDFELEMRQSFEPSLSDLSGWDRSDRQPQTLPPHHYLQDHPSGLRQPLSPPLCVFLLSVSLF